jgi:peptidoglycan/xylan/chitin deacetylase (PgdA/CDA1 family)
MRSDTGKIWGSCRLRVWAHLRPGGITLLHALLAAFLSFAPVAERTAAPALAHMSTQRRAVALTVNDGPDGRVTPMILRLLQEHGARATFFVNGEALRDDPQMLLEIRAAGSEIGNHAYHHRSLAGRPYREVADELQRTAELMSSAYPAIGSFLRPPFGAVDKTVLRAARARGLRVVLSGPSGSDETLRAIPAQLHPGDIISVRNDLRGLRQLKEILRILEREHIEADSLGMMLTQH